ncbi:glucosamine-6-phosphate deaminase [Proteiniclasticum sp. C24MP]|uniref:glucosamine-6-phosphate deaminase n=1 Tax=Proteiniclasticum sp. C24MP TaxID=3374101 RepID=UPI0037543555
MNFRVFDSYEEVSAYSAELLAEVISEKEDAVLGLATGSSPVGMYKELIKLHEEGKLDFSKAKSINLDEYVGLDGSHDQSYRYFMNTNLFDHVNMDKKNTFVPDGTTDDLMEGARKYDELIESMGGIDVQVLGIGPNGHIGFNEPADELKMNTHVAELTEETIQANARFFASEKDVPTRAVTMGVGPIMKAKKIILIASGENKAWAVKSLVDDVITTKIPATLLKLHPDVTVVLDKEAAGML